MSFRPTLITKLRLKPINKPKNVLDPEGRWAMDTMTRSEAAVRSDRAEPVPISKLQEDTIKAIEGNHQDTDFEGWAEFKETPQVQGNLMPDEYKEKLKK
jgi:hypothetical protein